MGGCTGSFFEINRSWREGLERWLTHNERGRFISKNDAVGASLPGRKIGRAQPRLLRKLFAFTVSVLEATRCLVN